MRLRQLGFGALALLAVVISLLAVALWRSHMPAAPDWRVHLSDALAAQDCVQAAGVLAAAIDADVPEAFGEFDRLFLADGSPCGADDLVAADKANWLIGSLPQTRDDVLARSARAANARDTWPGPVRRAALLLLGLQPWLPGADDYEYQSAYPGIGFALRPKLVWLTLGCDPVMTGYGGPNWPALEARLQPVGERWRQGAWNDRAQTCATEVADLVEHIGIGATGPHGDLVADLLVAAPFAVPQPRIAYLKAQRALDYELAHKWAAPDPDGTRLVVQGIGDLYTAATQGHAQAMARIGRLALAGELAPVFEDMSARDERMAALVFLSLAQDFGQPVAAEVEQAMGRLTSEERASADEMLAGWRDEFALPHCLSPLRQTRHSNAGPNGSQVI
ncbi:hypothetical protein [Pyruvatibacter sp.]|uniref:hypothetical protein n=1 Tax=Pyruvatibacter sp. TaxID=1981328 RepID=UPI0032EFED12